MTASALQRALDFIAAAEQAANMPELEQLMGRVLQDFGVTDFSITAAVPRADNGARIPRKLTRTVDAGWSEHYLERKYYNVDFCVHLALQQPHAFSWIDFEKRAMPDSARQLFVESRDHLKIDGGFVVPTHDSRGFAGFVAMFHEQSALEPQAQKALKIIAIYGIERAKELHGLELDRVGWDTPCPLTARQRELLSFAAAGKSDWDTGQILSLSEKTVNKHLERAKTALDVRTRAQAVAIAIQRGWVTV